MFKVKLSGPPLNPVMVKATNLLWMVKAPSEIMFFGWRLIHNRIAIKDQLHKRRILVDSSDLLCVLCLLEEESLMHILRGFVVAACI